MLKTHRTVFLVILLVDVIYGQNVIGRPCNLQSSQARGVCKLLTNCKQVRNEVVNLQRLPQTCGFQETQPIVCCPNEAKPGDISRQKCKEYSLYAQKNETRGITENECGHKIVKPIVGGIVATRKEFPHMAALGFETSSGIVLWLCGGSVISERYILTAAHCVLNTDRVEIIGVYVDDADQRQDVPISEIITHPKYEPREHEHDIALLKLKNSIKFNSYLRPACLYTDFQIPVEKAIATGWILSNSGRAYSNNFRKATLNLVDHDFCNMTYKVIGIRDDIHICAESTSEEENTCEGDTGGPLQIYHEGDEIMCMYDIIGVTSFGKGCSGGPSVYTRVSHYIEWIESVVWPSK